MGGAFDVAKQIKGAACQRYGDRDVIARCEQILRTLLQPTKVNTKSDCSFQIDSWKMQCINRPHR